MAGNNRGKLKEEFQGIHRNFDWITKHCQESLILIKDKHAGLKTAIEALHKGCELLDKAAQDIYWKI